MLKEVLEKNQADYGEALEPDILVAVYPDQFFPFVPSHYQLVRERDEREARENLKKEQNNLPDELFTFIVFVDA